MNRSFDNATGSGFGQREQIFFSFVRRQSCRLCEEHAGAPLTRPSESHKVDSVERIVLPLLCSPSGALCARGKSGTMPGRCWPLEYPAKGADAPRGY